MHAIWFDPMQAETSPEAWTQGQIYTRHCDVCLGHIFISLPLLKIYWEPDFCIGMDQMLIILTANMLGNDIHSQICRSAHPGLPKQTIVQSTGLCRMQQ